MQPISRSLFVIVALVALPALTTAQSVVSGRIRADQYRTPLAGAEVLISTLNLRATSDRDGRYLLTAVPPGQHDLEIRLIGYAPARLTLEAETGDSLELDVVLLPVPFELPELTAEAARVRSARLAAFEHRRRMGLGRFITEEDLKSRTGSTLADILQTRGVNFRVDPYKFLAAPVARSEFIEGQSSYCYMHVLVDGVEVPVETINLNTTAIQDYAAIEVYQRMSGIPIEYTATGLFCGAIFLWTKS